MGRRGNLMFGKLILQSYLHLIGGDCFVAHLSWRAVPGKIAPRNDIKKEFL